MVAHFAEICLSSCCNPVGPKDTGFLGHYSQVIKGISWVLAAKTEAPGIYQSCPPGDSGPLECGKGREHPGDACQGKEGKIARWHLWAKARQRGTVKMVRASQWACR